MDCIYLAQNRDQFNKSLAIFDQFRYHYLLMKVSSSWSCDEEEKTWKYDENKTYKTLTIFHRSQLKDQEKIILKCISEIYCNNVK